MASDCSTVGSWRDERSCASVPPSLPPSDSPRQHSELSFFPPAYWWGRRQPFKTARSLVRSPMQLWRKKRTFFWVIRSNPAGGDLLIWFYWNGFLVRANLRVKSPAQPFDWNLHLPGRMPAEQKHSASCDYGGHAKPNLVPLGEKWTQRLILPPDWDKLEVCRSQISSGHSVILQGDPLAVCGDVKHHLGAQAVKSTSDESSLLPLVTSWPYETRFTVQQPSGH